MTSKKVIIAGAGVSGLSAGIYACRAGYDVLILEQGHNVGGLSSHWSRGKYNFEGGMHWLLGSTEKFGAVHRMWKETGALGENNPVEITDPYVTLFEGKESLALPRNIGALRRTFLEKSPGDKGAVSKLCRDISLFKLFFTGSGPMTFLARILLLVPLLVRSVMLCRISTLEYVGKFSDRRIRALLGSVINPGHNALSLVYTMAAYAAGDCGYPAGGSAVLTSNLKKSYDAAGGALRLNCRVSKVVTGDGEVKGVIAGGEFIPADEVIVTCDTRKALDTLFDRPLEEKWACKMHQGLVSQQCMFVYLGVKASLSSYPMSIRVMPGVPVEAGGESFDCLEVYNYGDSTRCAPKGCSVLTVILRADCYDFWTAALNDGTYHQRKDEVVEKVTAALALQFPEIEENVEVAEMATPLTYERFTDSFRGGWMTVWKPGTFPKFIPPKCRSVRGLHFAGQRTMLSGGLPIAVRTGRAAAKSIR